MEIGAIFFMLAVAVLVGLYIGQPFFLSRVRRATQMDHEYSTLMAEYDRAVNTLQELDFDHNLGKVPEEDYPTQRAELLAIGAELLRKLDVLKPQKTKANAESRLEAAVASRRADSSDMHSAGELRDEDLESMIAARRKSRNGKSAGFCPKCGKPILQSDRFCPSCGKALN